MLASKLLPEQEEQQHQQLEDFRQQQALTGAQQQAGYVKVCLSPYVCTAHAECTPVVETVQVWSAHGSIWPLCPPAWCCKVIVPFTESCLHKALPMHVWIKGVPLTVGTGDSVNVLVCTSHEHGFVFQDSSWCFCASSLHQLNYNHHTIMLHVLP